MKNEKVSKCFVDCIKEYLDNRVSEDELFATMYAKESKSVEECCAYIISEVQKSGRCGFADDEIYGMAVHYYCEDNLEINNVSAKVVVNHHVELTESQKQKLRKQAEDDYKQSIKMQLANEERKKAEAEKKKAEAKKSAKQAQITKIVQLDLFG